MNRLGVFHKFTEATAVGMCTAFQNMSLKTQVKDVNEFLYE